jgi:putrescine importer
MTFFNLRKVQWLSRMSALLLAVSLVVIVWSVIAAIGTLRGGTGAGTVLSLKPIINPATFHWGTLFAGTAIACFSFLGFNAVSTLAHGQDDQPGRVRLRAA